MACIISVCCSQVNFAYAWNEDNPDNPFDEHSIVTFGLYKSDTGEIGVSEPDYYFDHFKYGMAHGIYNYLYPIWHDNADFNFDVSILYDNLFETLGSSFFSDLTAGYWLMNVYLTYAGTINCQYLVVCNRAPNIQSNPFIDIRYNLNDKLTFEIMPENFGGSYFVFGRDTRTRYRMFSFAPYYLNDNISLDSNSLQSQSNSKFAFTNLSTQMQDLNLRSFWFTLTIDNFTGQVFTPSSVGWVKYFNSSTLRASSDRLDTYPTPLMVDFPVYKIVPYSTGGYLNYTTDDYYSGVKFNPAAIQQYQDTENQNLFDRDFTLSPIIISRYEDIPVPTATPTPIFSPSPIPTASITLVPSPTPIPPVNAVEGLGQMFTLFTRKYTFTINGAEIGIRPLYLFLACFFVGMLFRVFQGGGSE